MIDREISFSDSWTIDLKSSPESHKSLIECERVGYENIGNLLKYYFEWMDTKYVFFTQTHTHTQKHIPLFILKLK